MDTTPVQSLVEPDSIYPTVDNSTDSTLDLSDESTAPGWAILIFGLAAYVALAVATVLLSRSAEPLAAAIPAIIIIGGWMNGSLDMRDYFEDVQGLSPWKSSILAAIFCLVATTPLAYLLLPNAHRLSAKYGL